MEITFICWFTLYWKYEPMFLRSVWDLAALLRGSFDEVRFISAYLPNTSQSSKSQNHHIYRPKRSFGHGNIFTSVCLSTGGGYPSMPCRSVLGGWWVSQHALQVSPRGGLVPGGVSPIWGVSNFPGWGVEVGCLQFFGGFSNFFGGGWLGFGFFLISAFFRDAPLPRTRHRNTVNVRPVRILLECILVVLACPQKTAKLRLVHNRSTPKSNGVLAKRQDLRIFQ